MRRHLVRQSRLRPQRNEHVASKGLFVWTIPSRQRYLISALAPVLDVTPQCHPAISKCQRCSQKTWAAPAVIIAAAQASAWSTPESPSAFAVHPQRQERSPQERIAFPSHASLRPTDAIGRCLSYPYSGVRPCLETGQASRRRASSMQLISRQISSPRSRWLSRLHRRRWLPGSA